MFISSATIKNFRLFGEEFALNEEQLNVPDDTNPGSGLTILVGENGTGKSAILEALAFPLIGYKAETVCLHDFNDLEQKIDITLSANIDFEVRKSLPRGSFLATGFNFKANLRRQRQGRYLSSPIVSDSYFIQAAGQGVDSNSPDLRTAVNNPFSGPRFNENDYLFIDKNRTKQLESGLFSPSRFDRILQDFNFQYLKANSETLPDLNAAIEQELESADIKNEYLKKAFEQFQKITDYEVAISLISNQEPFTKSYLSYKDGNAPQLPVDKLGSGFQMFLAILCQYYLSLQSNKNLIIFIDEAELHLHYKLQNYLAKLLLMISKKAQVIVSTHSPQLLKDLKQNTKHKVNVLKKNASGLSINPTEDYVLPTPSVNEATYVAFQLPGIEYFNELYGYLQELVGEPTISSFDNHISQGQSLIDWERPTGVVEHLTIHSCLRHKIHHPDNTLNDSKFDFDEELPNSIEFLRDQIKEINS